jgi:NAD+ synthase
MRTVAFSKGVLKIDAAGEVARICKVLRFQLAKVLKRRGAVVGISGGIDSSVTLGLAVKALTPNRVLALIMPERHSAEETLRLSQQVAKHFDCAKITEEINGILVAVGYYQRYREALRKVIPEYGRGWKSKLVKSKQEDRRGFSLFYIVAQKPDGSLVKKRLGLEPYLEILAATSFKQRIRKMIEYYHADRLNYSVLGTPNRLEYDQGFFVKQGDGEADVKPIAHLYKTQVYQLAEYLDIPLEIRNRPPTTDTYSLEQGQDEFYFDLPYDKMDLCLYGKNNNLSPSEVSPIVGLTREQVQAVYEDIDTKRATTRYLHLAPLLIEEIPEISDLV